MNGKLGSASAIEYFCNRRNPSHPPGFLILAPYSSAPMPYGYTREFADDLPSVDRLQSTLLSQEKRDWESERLTSETVMAERQRAVVDRLRQLLCSSATSPYEREFIAAYLQLRDEKRDKYRKVWEHRVAYLSVLAHETPKGRDPNEERVDLDRLVLP
jgi:hypothetical protein